MLEQTTSVEKRNDIERVLADFVNVRKFSEKLCKPLKPEDYNLQAIAETSPAKWHLAHTSWFFETFILKKFQSNYSCFDPQYEYLFNSYYYSIGEQYPRPNRGLLSKPDVEEVYRYRQFVTEKIQQLINQLTDINSDSLNEVISLIRLGINHEQQHQELLLTDIKYNLFQNPIFPAYRDSSELVVHSLPEDKSLPPVEWIAFDEQLVSIGDNHTVSPISQSSFVYDNETPKHKFYRHSFLVANRLTTNGEYLKFIEQGGYSDPQYWLSDGWDAVRNQKWQAPLYWYQQDGNWYIYTLNGVQSLQLDQPVTHVSYYEADAFARWSGARLLTEQEWESIATGKSLAKGFGNFVEDDVLHPVVAKESDKLKQMFGDVWEWTSSAYSAYPGFKPAAGAVGEYNGKFMCNQYVLRGGSCVTSRSHIRKTYRNFFYPDARWQFSGIRLARDS